MAGCWLSDRADNVARTLKPANDELLAQQYIAEIELTGRGRDKLVRYVFGPPPVGDYPELAELLRARGVKSGVAVRLSTVFPDRIEDSARRFDHYVQTTSKAVVNPGGLLVAMIQRPEDFADLPGYVPARPKSESVTAPVAGTRQAKNRAPHIAEVEALEAREKLRVAALDGQALVDWVLRQLSLLGTIKHLSVQERALLSEAVAVGTLDGRTVVREATWAVAGGAPAVRAVVEDVRAHLSKMLP